MFTNQNWGNGFVLLIIAMMTFFISPIINGLGASLAATFIGGLSAIIIANVVLAPKKEGTEAEKIE